MEHNNEAQYVPKSMLQKSPTGIQGLDEITFGGLPQGRTALICGAAGCGKTMLAMEYLVNGARLYNEPGVFIAFEETEAELIQNFASLGYDLEDLASRKLLAFEYVHVERGEIEETGEYDLEGLFIRLGYAIDSVRAKRVVLDTIESLFSGFQNDSILRAELRRLFRWLKNRGVTSIITGERGERSLTRGGLEEYVSDCVIELDNRVEDLITTRRLRILKYRGSAHGTNEYPFLIDEQGISVQPISSIGLDHPVSQERISSGIGRLDQMMDGQGYYRGSSILVSGTSGSGKSTVAAHFVKAAGQRGERCLYFAMEESAAQIIRNQLSTGIDLKPLVEQGLLKIHSARPSLYGLEMHLVTMQKLVNEFQPRVVVLDPVSNLISVGSMVQVRSMLTRLIDWLKVKQTTSLYISLTPSGDDCEQTDIGISSLMDTWLLLRDIELNGERNRGLYILKSRGMAHSNQIREFIITNHGVDLLDAYLGPGGVLTGTTRLIQEQHDRELEMAKEQEITELQYELEQKRQALESKILALRGEFAARETAMNRIIVQQQSLVKIRREGKARVAESRKSNNQFND
ncbi:MAG: circadian clock protein KaiC [Syntrophomonadaceae bacterium]